MSDDEVKPLMDFIRAFKLSTARIHTELEAAGIETKDLLDACRIVLHDYFNNEAGSLAIAGPCKVVIKKAEGETGSGPMYRHAACIGGEALKFQDVYMGAKSGIVMQFELELPRHNKSGSAGVDAEFSTYKNLENIEVTEAGEHRFMSFQKHLTDHMLDKDLLDQAENIKNYQEEAERKAKAKAIVQQKEHYGRRYGSWG